jgi:hypothetical protein
MVTCSQLLHVAVNDMYSCMHFAVELYMHSHNLKLINATKISTKEKLTLHGVTVLRITTHSDTMHNAQYSISSCKN